jgi:hypothetical protein
VLHLSRGELIDQRAMLRRWPRCNTAATRSSSPAAPTGCAAT